MLLGDLHLEWRLLTRIECRDLRGLLAQLLSAGCPARATSWGAGPWLAVKADHDDDLLGSIGADVLHGALERVDPPLRVEDDQILVGGRRHAWKEAESESDRYAGLP